MTLRRAVNPLSKLLMSLLPAKPRLGLTLRLAFQHSKEKYSLYKDRHATSSSCCMCCCRTLCIT